MLHHEAMALLELHSQAVAVSNIRNHVTTILDVDSGNFNRWFDQFQLILGKFSLQGHVREDPPDPVSPDWARMDYVVKSWIVATFTDDLGEIISPGAPPHDTLGSPSSRSSSATARPAPFNWRRGSATSSRATSLSPSTAAS
jgi:hypothetical protein